MKLNKYQVKKICNKLNETLIKFSFLAKGSHNSNYILETTTNRYILRIEDNQQFKNLKKEYNFLKSVNSELGPKVFFFDNSYKIIPNDYLIEEFIDGKHPSEKNIPNDFVIQMAKWFQRLHKNTIKMPKPYLLLTEIKPYYRNYLKYKKSITDNKLKQKLEDYISKALKLLKKNNKIYVSRKRLSLLHNDTSSGNIFYKPSHIRLIDWEFVDYGLPERELVYFLDSYHLTDKQQKLFLKSYGYSNTQKSKTNLIVTYIILLFSSIGYSLWQLDLLSKNKSSEKDKNERMKRLKRDIKLLKEKISKI